ncbi:MAG TPA: hypothetical protein VMI73_30615 [Trebonia sp.]|nr:hypothetical protein [Trebonia sp.]
MKPKSAGKSKAKAVKKAKAKASAAPTGTVATRPSTNANGVTQTAALTPGSEPDDVLSGLIR